MEQKTEVFLQIRGETDEADSVVEIDTVGFLSEDEYGIYVDYSDDRSGEAFSRIAISGDVVTLNRIGDIVTTMVFEQGKTFHTIVAATEGALELDLVTHSVVTEQTANKILLKLRYSLEAAGMASNHTLQMVAQKKAEELC